METQILLLFLLLFVSFGFCVEDKKGKGRLYKDLQLDDLKMFKFF